MTVQVYTTPGTYAGHETDPTAWTLRATGSGVSAGLDRPTPVNFGRLFTLAAGSSQGVAVVVTGASQARTNGTGSNQHFANADLALDLGTSSNAAFSSLVFTPRVWNGAIHYAQNWHADCNMDGAIRRRRAVRRLRPERFAHGRRLCVLPDRVCGVVPLARPCIDGPTRMPSRMSA